MNYQHFDTLPNPGDNEEAVEAFVIKLQPSFKFKHPAILRVKKTVVCSGNTQANKRCKIRVAGSSVSYCRMHSPILPAPAVEVPKIPDVPVDEVPLRRCGYCFAVEGVDVVSNLVSVYFCVGREVLLCIRHLDLIKSDDIYTVQEAVNNV